MYVDAGFVADAHADVMETDNCLYLCFNVINVLVCREQGIYGWWTTSALTGESIHEGFFTLLQRIMQVHPTPNSDCSSRSFAIIWWQSQFVIYFVMDEILVSVCTTVLCY